LFYKTAFTLKENLVLVGEMVKEKLISTRIRNAVFNLNKLCALRDERCFK
jgi:hypothetical protein